MPGHLIFGAFALSHSLIAFTAFLLVPVSPMVAGSLLIVEVVTAFDNLVIVLGKSIGIGPTAKRLNRTRFFLHAVFIGLLVPVYWGIGAMARVPALNTETSMYTAIGAAVAIGLFGFLVQYRKVRLIFPVNCYGCLRYAQSVSDDCRWPGYDYSEAELAQKAFPPLASIVTVLIGLILSLWVGLSADVWIPFAVTLLMFGASGFAAKPGGALATSCLEVIYSAGLLYTIWALAGQPHVH